MSHVFSSKFEFILFKVYQVQRIYKILRTFKMKPKIFSLGFQSQKQCFIISHSMEIKFHNYVGYRGEIILTKIPCKISKLKFFPPEKRKNYGEKIKAIRMLYFLIFQNDNDNYKQRFRYYLVSLNLHFTEND